MQKRPGRVNQYRQHMIVSVLSGMLLGGAVGVPLSGLAQSPATTPPASHQQSDLRGMLTTGDGRTSDTNPATTRTVSGASLPPATAAGDAKVQTTLGERGKARSAKRDASRSETRERRRTLGNRSYEITRSGRLRDSSSAALAFDGDPATTWSSAQASPAAYAWFDLGAQREVGAIRWLMPVASGPLTIQLSDDRQEWTTVHVDPNPASESWRTINVAESGRYVRFLVSTQSGGVELAEVEVLRPRTAAVTTSGQQSTAPQPPSVTVTDADGQRQEADADIQTPVADSREPVININGKETRCSGSGKCEVRGTAPAVTNDCGDGTTSCTITVGVSGGIAICDASGDNRKRGGGGRRGATCTADASSGTVDIGDVGR